MRRFYMVRRGPNERWSDNPYYGAPPKNLQKLFVAVRQCEHQWRKKQAKERGDSINERWMLNQQYLQWELSCWHEGVAGYENYKGRGLYEEFQPELVKEFRERQKELRGYE